MDMGAGGTLEIYALFQCVTKITMNMGSTPGRISMRLPALSNPNPKGDPMTKSLTLKSAALALVVAVAGISQAAADSGPTMQEKMACRADAESLCSQFIGKTPQMRACLAQNKTKLSAPCRAVVEAHGG
jgi:hypothetical protein